MKLPNLPPRQTSAISKPPKSIPGQRQLFPSFLTNAQADQTRRGTPERPKKQPITASNTDRTPAQVLSAIASEPIIPGVPESPPNAT